MNKFDKLKADIEQHPAVQDAAPRQRAVLDTARMIYNWRTAAGLSQLELANAIGTKQESISRIERGTSKDGPKLSTLAAIAKACGQRLVIGGQPETKAAADDDEDHDAAWSVFTDAPIPAPENHEWNVLQYRDLTKEQDEPDNTSQPSVVWVSYQGANVEVNREEDKGAREFAQRVAKNPGVQVIVGSSAPNERPNVRKDSFYSYVVTSKEPVYGRYKRSLHKPKQGGLVSSGMVVVSRSKDAATQVAGLLVKGGGKSSYVYEGSKGSRISGSDPLRQRKPGSENAGN